MKSVDEAMAALRSAITKEQGERIVEGISRSWTVAIHARRTERPKRRRSAASLRKQAAALRRVWREKRKVKK